MMIYEEQHGQLPPAAVCGEDGTPLLSWRVLLLPFIEQKELFARFKLDEPWDGPNNRELLAEMPHVFRPYDGSSPPEPNTTFYQVFVGKGTAFESGVALRLRRDFPDGVSNTFLVIEAGTAVPWTKPEDLPYAADKPVPQVGGLFKDSFRVGFADGHARGFLRSITEDSLRAGIVRNDGKHPVGD
jgi:hypothetical protein